MKFKIPRKVVAVILISAVAAAGTFSVLSYIDSSVAIEVDSIQMIDDYQIQTGNGLDVLKWNINPLCIASDEFAAAQQPRGIQFWQYINDTARNVFRYARLHNIFTSSEGDRRGASNAGGDVVIDNGDGTYSYDWTRVDNLFDTIVSCNITPLVELGFMPKVLSSQPNEEPERHIPENWDGWTDLIHALLVHLEGRYTLNAMKTWRFEVWNEPDAGSFWNDGIDAYCDLYNHTANKIRDYNADLIVGGPGIANDMDEFRIFLEYCTTHNSPLDFISFHTKGSDGEGMFPKHRHLLDRMENYFMILGDFPEFDQNSNPDMEYICTEADPIVGSHRNKFDKPKFRFRDNNYYSAWFSHTLINLVQLQIEYNYSLHGLFSHNILFPWEAKSFYGTRGFLTPLFKEGTPIDTAIPEDMPLPECDAVVGKPIFIVAQLIDQIPHGSRLLDVEVNGYASDTGKVKCLAFNCTDGIYRLLISHHDRNDYFSRSRTAALNIQLGSQYTGTRVTVDEYRVDNTLNNAFTLYKSYGAPDYVTETQISALQQEANLSRTASYEGTVSDSVLELNMELTRATTILVEIMP